MPTDVTSEVRLAGFAPDSRVNGPGRRVVIWVQGCDLACPGCFNPQTHPRDAEDVSGVSPMALVERILRARSEVSVGVTFSGGEPFQQARALAVCARGLRRAWPGVSLMAFTGYPLEALRGGGAPAGSIELLDQLDMLVDGRYDPRRPSTRAWRASGNQRLWVLGRAPVDWSASPDAELHVDAAGNVLLSGFPDATLRRVVKELAR